MIKPQDLAKMYYIPESEKKHILLSKCNDGRYKIYDSADRLSELFARVLVDYTEEEKKIFLDVMEKKLSALKVLAGK